LDEGSEFGLRRKDSKVRKIIMEKMSEG